MVIMVAFETSVIAIETSVIAIVLEKSVE